MELESIQSGSSNSDIPKNYKTDASEGDAKEAFLAVLQGLVGFLNPTPALPANIPQYKIAELELKENHRAVKDESKFEDKLDNSHKSQKDDSDTSQVSKENIAQNTKAVETGREEDISAAIDKAVKVESGKEKDNTEDQIEEVAIVVNAESQSDVVNKVVETKSLEQVPLVESNELEKEAQIVTDQAVLSDLMAKDIKEEVVVLDKVIAPDKQLKKAKAETILEEPILAESSMSEIKPEISPEAKETIKVLNAKPLNKEGRSLEDEIEISYFEAKDLMSKSLDLKSTTENQPILKPILQPKEVPVATVLADLLSQSSILSYGFSDIGANALMAKNSNIKLDPSHASIQANKQVFDKGNSDKIISNSFSARTAQAQVLIDKVKAVLEQATINKTNDTITVKVEPANLGELTIKVSEKKGQIYAKITPESKEVEEILRSQGRELSLVIQALGYKEEDVQVSVGSASPDFYNAFSQSAGFQGENSGFNKAPKKSGLGMANGTKESGINIDNNLTREDLVGWIA